MGAWTTGKGQKRGWERRGRQRKPRAPTVYREEGGSGTCVHYTSPSKIYTPIQQKHVQVPKGKMLFTF